MIALPRALPADAPLDPSSGEARSWLQRELLNPEYHQQNVVEQLITWLERQIGRGLAAAAQAPPLSTFAAMLIFLLLLGGLNVFIGIFNLFPLLPLDGGHVAIAWFERARSWVAARRGKEDPGRVDYNKLLPVTYAVILLFGGLTVLTLAADIVNPVRLQ